MYKLLIGFYLIYSARNNFSHLFSDGKSFPSFSRVDWVLATISFLMVPTAVAMFYLGYKELKQKREEMEEQEKSEELERKRKAEDIYLNNDPDDMDDMLNREEDSYKSPYDS
jgi:hypothetical protein